jgi:DNA-binding GntR family transcriptional regulator
VTPSIAKPSGRFGKVARLTLRDQVVETLRNAILQGKLPPGAPVVEATLAREFSVSRGPLREAMRQLIEEGLLVTVRYTGTTVTQLSIEDIREIGSMRGLLEAFAFELVWDRRDGSFAAELRRRHDVLTTAILEEDEIGSIVAELDLHSLVYEVSGHSLLQATWKGLRGRLQLYWSAHHRAHGLLGPQLNAHEGYVAMALGDDLAAMKAEISDHMRRGMQLTERLMKEMEQPALSTHVRRTP